MWLHTGTTRTKKWVKDILLEKSITSSAGHEDHVPDANVQEGGALGAGSDTYTKTTSTVDDANSKGSGKSRTRTRKKVFVNKGEEFTRQTRSVTAAKSVSRTSAATNGKAAANDKEGVVSISRTTAVLSKTDGKRVTAKRVRNGSSKRTGEGAPEAKRVKTASSATKPARVIPAAKNSRVAQAARKSKSTAGTEVTECDVSLKLKKSKVTISRPIGGASSAKRTKKAAAVRKPGSVLATQKSKKLASAAKLTDER